MAGEIIDKWTERLPLGFQKLDSGVISVSNIGDIKYTRYSYNSGILPIPILWDNPERAIIKLSDHIKKYWRIQAECKSDLIQLWKDCKAYPIPSGTKINLAIDNALPWFQDSTLSDSDVIRNIIGLNKYGSNPEQADKIVDAMREASLLPYDPDWSKMKNSFAAHLAQFLNTTAIGIQVARK